MNNNLKSARVKPADELGRNSDEPFVEDIYSVSEYACMYYMMTPGGCNQANHSRLLDK